MERNTGRGFSEENLSVEIPAFKQGPGWSEPEVVYRFWLHSSSPDDRQTTEMQIQMESWLDNALWHVARDAGVEHAELLHDLFMVASGSSEEGRFTGLTVDI